MLSRPLAFGLVAAACVVAAGGGAYIATLQHARHDSALAAAEDDRPVAPGREVAAQPPAGASPVTGAAQTPANPAAAQQPAAPPPGVAAPGDDPPASGKVSRKTAEPGSAPVRPNAARQQAQASPTSSGAQSDRGGVPAPQIPAPIVEVPQGAKPAAGSQPGSPAAPMPVPADPPREEPRAEPQKVWEELTVPAESVIGLQLESSLNSETARVEDRVEARVTRDVRVDGRIAIPAGTHAIGSVVLVERGGKIKDRSRLGVRFNTLVLPDASRLPVSTETVFREGEAPSNKSSAKIGGAAIGGAIIGAILGGGKGAAIGTGIGAAGGTAAAMAGDRQTVVLPAGTPLSVRVQAPLTVTIEK